MPCNDFRTFDQFHTQAAAQALRDGNLEGAEDLGGKLLSGFASLVDLADKMKGGKVDIQKLQLPPEYSQAETALRKYSALGQVRGVAAGFIPYPLTQTCKVANLGVREAQVCEQSITEVRSSEHRPPSHTNDEP